MSFRISLDRKLVKGFQRLVRLLVQKYSKFVFFFSNSGKRLVGLKRRISLIQDRLE